MAKRKLFWHVGPTDADTAFLPAALEAAGEANFFAPTADEARRADLDLRRAHAAAGLSRKEIEGHWSRLESAIWHRKGTWLLSTPAAALIDRDQFRLAMDGLRGVKVHFVLFRTEANAEEVDDALTTWQQPLHPDRVHVVSCQQSPQAIWDSFMRVAGLPETTLPEVAGALDEDSFQAHVLRRTSESIDTGRPEVLGTAAALLGESGADSEDELTVATRALARAAQEIAARDHEISRLLAENERLDRKRRKHKRRLNALREELSDEDAAVASDVEQRLGPVA